MKRSIELTLAITRETVRLAMMIQAHDRMNLAHNFNHEHDKEPPGYTIVPNYVFDNHVEGGERLSATARGLYCTIRRFPIDYRWSVRRLAEETGTGRYIVMNALTELKLEGFLLTYQPHKDDGHFDRPMYLILKKPDDRAKRINRATNANEICIDEDGDGDGDEIGGSDEPPIKTALPQSVTPQSVGPSAMGHEPNNKSVTKKAKEQEINMCVNVCGNSRSIYVSEADCGKPNAESVKNAVKACNDGAQDCGKLLKGGVEQARDVKSLPRYVGAKGAGARVLRDKLGIDAGLEARRRLAEVGEDVLGAVLETLTRNLRKPAATVEIWGQHVPGREISRYLQAVTGEDALDVAERIQAKKGEIQNIEAYALIALLNVGRVAAGE